MRPIEEIRRNASCDDDISIEKIATAFFALIAAVFGDVHRERGLAHRRTRRDDDQVGGLQPAVISSRSVKPVARPVTEPLLS